MHPTRPKACAKKGFVHTPIERQNFDGGVHQNSQLFNRRQKVLVEGLTEGSLQKVLGEVSAEGWPKALRAKRPQKIKQEFNAQAIPSPSEAIPSKSSPE